MEPKFPFNDRPHLQLDASHIDTCAIWIILWLARQSSAMSSRGLKKLFFSCETCRRRKVRSMAHQPHLDPGSPSTSSTQVKCGQEQPKCHRCIARSDECIYKKRVHPSRLLG